MSKNENTCKVVEKKLNKKVKKTDVTNKPVEVKKDTKPVADDINEATNIIAAKIATQICSKKVENDLNNLVKKLHLMTAMAKDLYTPIENRIFEAALDGEENVVILVEDEPEKQVCDILSYLGFMHKYNEGELVISWFKPTHCEGYNAWHTAEECKNIAMQFKDISKLVRKFVNIAEKRANVGHCRYQLPVNSNGDLLKVYINKFYPDIKFDNGILTLEW